MMFKPSWRTKYHELIEKRAETLNDLLHLFNHVRKFQNDELTKERDEAIKERDAAVNDLNTFMKWHHENYINWKTIAQTTIAENANLKKELDAATAQFENMKEELISSKSCKFCTHYIGDCSGGCNYEWAAVQPLNL